MPWTKVMVAKQEEHIDTTSGEGTRILSYSEALKEAFDQAMANDERVYMMGQGIDDPSGMFGTTTGLQEKYGKKRVFDTPLAENGLMGIAVGSAITGSRPIYLHNRPDFLYLAMDQIVNHASKWHYMFGGKSNAPLVIWSVIGRGWGSAAQHSQAPHSFFMHVPGIRLVMPSTAYDAKGLMLESIVDENPVVIIEHRWLLRHKGYVPEHMYRIPFGKGVIRRAGADVTIAGVSQMIIEAQKAAETLEKRGISAEVIDLRTLKPWDKELLFTSLKKTGKLVLVDNGWKCGGATAEIAATVVEEAFDLLKAPVKRVSCPDLPTPAGYTLEQAYYPDANTIVEVVTAL